VDVARRESTEEYLTFRGILYPPWGAEIVAGGEDIGLILTGIALTVAGVASVAIREIPVICTGALIFGPILLVYGLISFAYHAARGTRSHPTYPGVMPASPPYAGQQPFGQAPQPPSQGMAACPRCGWGIPQGAAYCVRCGLRVGTA